MFRRKGRWRDPALRSFGREQAPACGLRRQKEHGSLLELFIVLLPTVGGADVRGVHIGPCKLIIGGEIRHTAMFCRNALVGIVYK